MTTLAQHIATELSVKVSQVETTIELLDGGATVPFIARYRKEQTQGLDDTQLRFLEERLIYLREMNKRRDAIIKSISEQGKLNDILEKALHNATTKTALEDIYLPYKPKRRTKAEIAREAGLQALANHLLKTPSDTPTDIAQNYINKDKGIEDSDQALAGARQILMEEFSENASLMGECREYLWQLGVLSAKVQKGKEIEGAKFKDYFEYAENINKIPSHRALALFRGRNENILRLDFDVLVENKDTHPCEQKIATAFNIADQSRAGDAWLLETVRWAWKVKIHSRLDIDLKLKLREAAELEAIRVFSTNLKDLLLAAPAGPQITIGLDPGIRTGVKVAIVDKTGKVLATDIIYPHQPRKQWDQSIETIQKLIKQHQITLISIGNGTGSRETDQLCADLIKRYPNKNLTKIMVSEAGASVYSASALAAKEFPDMDVSLRGAVSIARRLQDPLAELVKIDPKSIGVGQYQHDVNQTQLSRSLEVVVEDCVNAVGVDINMASAPLLSYVAGLNKTIAQNIVNYRDENGRYTKRNQLKKVARLGPKAFQQSAGFLRIMGGSDPLDASAVHPESASIVKAIAVKNSIKIEDIIANSTFLQKLQARDYINDDFGIPTVTDIIAELEKPGRDPRPEFTTATFKDGVEKISDLEPDMVLEGVVTNVTNFGAFVDIGVHQDGLVHISQLADRFVKDPHEVVKAGQIVKVKVQEVDEQRKRIALTMKRMEAKAPPQNQQRKKPQAKAHQQNKPQKNGTESAMMAAFRKAQ
ncbi:MAG: RNA-binding transcriptional accessory protein [Thiotrichaceae bacterium]|nr:RNA-binding transcriptional accessory protein [Thiotrichaceae bacterium]